MTGECLVAQLGKLAFNLIPKGLEDHDLSIEELEAYRLRTMAMFENAEHQIREHAQQTAEDVADDILAQELDEAGR